MEAELAELSFSPIPLPRPSTAPKGFSTRTPSPPPHYTFKLQGFSRLSVSLLRLDRAKYSSSTFESGGYKWRLDLYPKGDIERNTEAKGYLSLYLVILDTDKFPNGWEVNVDLKMFLYNQNRNEYHIIEDSEGRVSRFNCANTENGFSRLIKETTFNDTSNGYLVGDACTFGAEVFIIRNNAMNVEVFTALKCVSIDERYRWELPNFCKNNVDRYESDIFCAAGRKWRIIGRIIQKSTNEKYLTLDLQLITESYGFLDLKLNLFKWLRRSSNPTITQEGDILVYCSYYARDQIDQKHIGNKVYGWFRVKSGETVCELNALVPIDRLQDPSKGFLVDDTLLIDFTFERVREVVKS